MLCQSLVRLCFSCLLFVLSPQISTLRRQGRTLFSTVPETAEKEAHSLFVQEVKLIHTWMWACFVHSSSLTSWPEPQPLCCDQSPALSFLLERSHVFSPSTKTQVFHLCPDNTAGSHTLKTHQIHTFNHESSQGFILICLRCMDKAKLIRFQSNLVRKTNVC